MKVFLKCLSLLLMVFSIYSCNESEDEFVDYGPIDEKIIVDYLAKNNIDAQRDSSGMYYYVDKRGEEDTIPEDAFLDCFVIGYTASDDVFYDRRNTMVSFPLSVQTKAWKLGLSKIGKGGKVRLYIPSALNNYPNNIVVFFDITVVDYNTDNYKKRDEALIRAYLDSTGIEAQRDTSGLYYKIKKSGSGGLIPDNSMIDVNYIGKLLNGNVIDKGDNIYLELPSLIKGLIVGLPKIEKGGEIQLFIPSYMGYGMKETFNNNDVLVIPASSVLIFDVLVNDFWQL